jgi:hypothetical protein
MKEEVGQCHHLCAPTKDGSLSGFLEADNIVSHVKRNLVDIPLLCPFLWAQLATLVYLKLDFL